ncbi:MAG: heme ABC exporter ATP-binding protein CcmA [Chloroflexi bacterium]|nr:heme ABC exporter ATP-binding protein CcmA [Chloroflexota bacterium]
MVTASAPREAPSGAAASVAIQVKGLRKAFGLNLALRGIDLAVARGERVVMFGPNGSGKTTLLKILSTVMRPTSGAFAINGLDAQQQAAAIRRSIGVVTHQPLLYEDLTALENLRFYGRMYGVADLEQRAQLLLARVGMARRQHDRVRTLSHGMQKRVTLARALLHDPSILLLDEPESGLDLDALAMLQGLLAAPTERGEQRTVLMTTHNFERGLDIAQRAAVLSQGRIVYHGTPNKATFRALYAQLTGGQP